MNAPIQSFPRLTSLSHGGGCGCKIAPGTLQALLARVAPPFPIPDALLVGIETSDDAAVYRINARQAIVATTDFFMPIVDDPFDFGAIAATNALSDVYAMGATPLFALAIVGMPVNVLPAEVIRRILEGGESICARANIPIAGGHSIDSVEPIYGLVAIGLVDPEHLKRNADGRAGDVLVLGKPLGVGVFSAAFKKGRLDDGDYARMVASATQLNAPGTALGAMPGVHAMTDVTGFGLAGHLLEICRGSRVGARIDYARIPVFPSVPRLVREGLVTGASARNLSAYGDAITMSPNLGERERAILADPQTSGGLLVSCTLDAVDPVLRVFGEHGFDSAAVIGELTSGAPVLRVDAAEPQIA